MKPLSPTMIFLACILQASPSTAHWQFTKWGMSRDALSAASQSVGADLRAANAEELKRYGGGARSGLTMDYSAGAFRFKAYFRFDDMNKLSKVQLYLVDGNFNELYRELLSKYGNPARIQNFAPATLVEYAWFADGDEISMFVSGAKALTLTYAPRVNAGNKGL